MGTDKVVGPNVNLLRGDCLSLMYAIPSQSVDLVLCDPPFGKTSLAWDKPLSFVKLWEHYDRICKGPVLLMGVDPFTSLLICSNLKDFRQRLVWDKGKGSNPLLANKQFMRSHEDIAVFYKKQPIYNPQMKDGKPYASPRTGGNRTNSIIGNGVGGRDKTEFKQNTKDTSKRFPLSILRYSIHCGSKLNPTQKPVGLMEELILTYTNKGMLVLDNCMGSGTTGVACVNTGRSFVGIEKEFQDFNVAARRIIDARKSVKL